MTKQRTRRQLKVNVNDMVEVRQNFQAIEWNYRNPPLNNTLATSAPTSADDSTKGYSVGSIWVDQNTRQIYRYDGGKTGDARWINISATGELGSVVPETYPITFTFTNSGQTNVDPGGPGDFAFDVSSGIGTVTQVAFDHVTYWGGDYHSLITSLTNDTVIRGVNIDDNNDWFQLQVDGTPVDQGPGAWAQINVNNGTGTYPTHNEKYSLSFVGGGGAGSYVTLLAAGTPVSIT
jgi:hypothetical protein